VRWIAALCAVATAAPAAAFLSVPATMPGLNRRAPVRAQQGCTGLEMALAGNEKVVVFGGFERLAVTIMQTLGNAGFKPVCPVPKGFTKDSQIKWGIDGLAPTLPACVQLAADGVPVVQGCVLASEEPVTGQDCISALQTLQGVEKVVFLSRVGVERKDSFFIKLNPFLKIQEWYLAEDAVKGWCAENGVECTILRTGKLEGGPFYQTQREFQAALEASLFDVEHKAFRLSRTDALDGLTGRDLTATGVREALVRDEPVMNLLSAKNGASSCSVMNHMNLPPAQTKERKVYTPSASDWDTAFSQL